MRRFSLFLAMIALVPACSRNRGETESKTADSADSAGSDSMAGMPGMKTGELTLTAEQVTHGKIAWAPADTGTEFLTATLPGRLVPNEDRTSRLGAPAQGRVVSVLVRPGDRVAAGSVLATLQSPEAGMAQSDLARAEAEVSSRRAQAQYARSVRSRAERLLALKAIPAQDYERTITDDELARTALAQAEAELRRTRSTAEQLGVSKAPSGVMELRAPRAGVVLARSAVPGVVVEPGAQLVVVTDLTSLWLTVSAPERAAGLFRVGMAVQFIVPAFPSDTFSAPVDAVGAGLDSATRTLPIRALVRNPGGRLKPEMLATVLVRERGGGAVLIVPADAVQLIAGYPTVFIATPDGRGGARLDARTVKTGTPAGGRVAVIEGLSPGEMVVTQGAFSVKAELLKAAMPKMEM
jgi:membrane fusion protein, heavy metal efflux system